MKTLLMVLILLGAFLFGAASVVGYDMYVQRHREPKLNGPCVDTAYNRDEYRWISCLPDQTVEADAYGKVIFCRCKNHHEESISITYF